jgi:hypothetical protein
MGALADLTFNRLNNRSGGSFWPTMAIVEEGAMDPDELYAWALKDYDDACQAPIFDSPASAKERAERGVELEILSLDDTDGRYHATALGHKYVQWMFKQWWGKK